jgi:hypothetical protein
MKKNYTPVLLEKIEDPEYISMTKDFKELRLRITAPMCNLQNGHYEMAMNALARILIEMYGDTNIEKLYEESVSHTTMETFCENLGRVLEKQELKPSTKRICLFALKRILSHTCVSHVFIEQVNIQTGQRRKLESGDVRNILPARFKIMDIDSVEFRTACRWIVTIRKNTRVKSFITLRQIMYYILSVFQKIGVNPEIEIKRDKNALIELLKPHIKMAKHSYYLTLFFKYVLCDEHVFVYDGTTVTKREGCVLISDTNNAFIKRDNDIHRFTVNELEAIYNASKSDLRSELIVFIFCTTGMRVGGLVNIRISNIRTIENGEIVINDTGRTLDKNRKWFTFVICNHLKKLLWEWIAVKRKYMFENDYLFPSRNGECLTTNTVYTIIKRICKSVGIEGPHVHPHSFRHTYAHMLLECGNSVENVARMLGHSSASTTEEYYLKESAAEVSKRSNIPWLDGPQKEKIVPDFLTKSIGENIADNNVNEKRKRRKQCLAILSEKLKNINVDTLNK